MTSVPHEPTSVSKTTWRIRHPQNGAYAFSAFTYLGHPNINLVDYCSVLMALLPNGLAQFLKTCSSCGEAVGWALIRSRQFPNTLTGGMAQFRSSRYAASADKVPEGAWATSAITNFWVSPAELHVRLRSKADLVNTVPRVKGDATACSRNGWLWNERVKR
jgi:hypothetical protein